MSSHVRTFLCCRSLTRLSSSLRVRSSRARTVFLCCRSLTRIHSSLLWVRSTEPFPSLYEIIPSFTYVFGQPNTDFYFYPLMELSGSLLCTWRVCSQVRTVSVTELVYYSHILVKRFSNVRKSSFGSLMRLSSSLLWVRPAEHWFLFPFPYGVIRLFTYVFGQPNTDFYFYPLTELSGSLHCAWRVSSDVRTFFVLPFPCEVIYLITQVRLTEPVENNVFLFPYRII